MKTRLGYEWTYTDKGKGNRETGWIRIANPEKSSNKIRRVGGLIGHMSNIVLRYRLKIDDYSVNDPTKDPSRNPLITVEIDYVLRTDTGGLSGDNSFVSIRKPYSCEMDLFVELLMKNLS